MVFRAVSWWYGFKCTRGKGLRNASYVLSVGTGVEYAEVILEEGELQFCVVLCFLTTHHWSDFLTTQTASTHL